MEDTMAKITVHPSFEIGEISPRLYSAFLEPIGTMVNGTMYNPGHPTADEQGFRKDFIGKLRAEGVPAVRMPGGNFVSGWNWKDSIGPISERKVRLDAAWMQFIPNDVGHDEYLQWAEKVGTEPLYTINLGTMGMQDAMDIVEYTNFEGGSYWSDLRAKNGHATPYGVKIWYLGNEVDGPWQLGSWEKNPKGYGVLSNEASKLMKWVDPTIETVVCVSCSPNLAHYPTWDQEVLEQCYEAVDYISMHHYHSAPPGDYGALLGGSVFFEDYINTEIALCDLVQTKVRSPKKMMLSFDEYGTMVRPNSPLHPGNGIHSLYASHYVFDTNRKYKRHDPSNMPEMPNFMRNPGIINALANATTLFTFLRHADRVKIGCATGGLGIMAASDKDHIWTPTTYYPVAHLMKYGKGTSLRCSIQCPTFDIPGYAIDDNSQYSTREGITFLDAAAAFDKEAGEVAVFVINRDWTADHSLELDVKGFEGYQFVEHVEMYSDDLEASDTYENPNAVVPTINENSTFDNGVIKAQLHKLSWNVFRFRSTKVIQ
jgi:alpha-N-arabinofuranosidase